MYKHHEDSLVNLINYFKEDKEIISIIFGGSVAKGCERIDSDLDVIIVVSDEKYARHEKENRLAETVQGHCTYEKGYFDVKYVTMSYLEIAAKKGSEPCRNAFISSRQIYEQLEKLKEAGFEYDALLMLGVAGKNAGIINTEATIKLLSTFNPYMVSIMPTSVTPGSELEAICDSGDYVELTELEMLREEIEFLKALDVDDSCYFFGSHNFNLVPVSGTMGERDKMISHLEKAIKNLDPKVLNSTKPRGPI